MDWKPGINPSYLFFLFGEIYLFGMKLGIIFFYYLESLFGNLIGELVLKLIVLWRAFNSRPSPHSRTGNISIGWISLHYFYPVMLLSFINERDVLLSDWEYIHGLDIFTLCHAASLLSLKNGMFSLGCIMYCVNPWDMDIWVFLFTQSCYYTPGGV